MDNLKNSNSSTRAKRKYNSENYSQLNIQLKTQTITTFKTYCKNCGIPQRAFIEQAIREKIERETGKKIEELTTEIQPAEESDTSESANISATEKGEE